MNRFGLTQTLISASALLAIVGVTVLGTVYTQPTQAQESAMRVLTVTGQGSEDVATSLTRVDLGVQAQGSTAAAVQQEVARRSAAVVELLQANNVEKLHTTGIQLQPRYDYSNNRTEIVGYMGSNTVSFQMPTERIGNLLDQAIETGANQINQISFIANEGAIATARQTALEEATEDAQRQANAVLRTLNLGAQEVVGIQINGAQGPIPIPLPAQARLEAVAADVTTPVVGGEQTVNASVTLQIRY
jgi:uncharacterized protein YggE